jgi:hypothetical protein
MNHAQELPSGPLQVSGEINQEGENEQKKEEYRDADESHRKPD